VKYGEDPNIYQMILSRSSKVLNEEKLRMKSSTEVVQINSSIDRRKVSWTSKSIYNIKLVQNKRIYYFLNSLVNKKFNNTKVNDESLYK